MNKNWKKICVRIVMVMMLVVAVPFCSFAASAKIAFSDPTGEVGGEVDVTMKFTCTSGDTLGNTDVMLSYDASMLEFISGEPNASGGSGAIRVTGGMAGKSELVTKLKFKALRAGSTKITITSWEGYDADGKMLNMEKQGNSAVTISGGNANYSTDAALKSLQISPGTLTPQFSPEVENYTTSVEAGTERLTVSAVPNSDKASVSLEGTELKDGENTVVCRVTAEDKTTVRNYTILVSRAGGDAAASGEAGEAFSSDLEILAQLEAARTPFKLGIAALPADAKVPAGMKESTITIGDTKVQGFTPKTAGGQPEYCVFYGVSGNGTEGYYRYDMTDKTIQRYFESAGAQEENAELIDVAAKYNDLVDDYNLMKWIAVAGGAAAVIFLIILIAVLSARSGRNRGREDRYTEPGPKPKERRTPAVRGRKMTREERYMMGEEDEYEEDADFKEEDYLPEEAAAAAEPVRGEEPAREVERTLEEKLAREASAAASEPDMAKAAGEDAEDDFEVFDLEDDK